MYVRLRQFEHQVPYGSQMLSCFALKGEILELEPALLIARKLTKVDGERVGHMYQNASRQTEVVQM